MRKKVQLVSGVCGTYLRVSRGKAAHIFEEGSARLYVMSSDRNPVNSPTSAHEYRKGCMPYYGGSERGSISTFGELVEDFSGWLDTEGYGHMPDRYRAEHELFSFWVRLWN